MFWAEEKPVKATIPLVASYVEKLSPLTVTRVIRPFDCPGVAAKVRRLVAEPKAPVTLSVPAPAGLNEAKVRRCSPPPPMMRVLPPVFRVKAAEVT